MMQIRAAGYSNIGIEGHYGVLWYATGIESSSNRLVKLTLSDVDGSINVIKRF